MKIAILGGNRFIGYHLANALAGGGHHVTLFNRGHTRAPGAFHPAIDVVIGDRNEPEHAGRLLTRPVDALYDLSGYSRQQALPFVTPVHRARIGHYIFCSTTSVYRAPPPFRFTEDAPRVTAGATYGGEKAAVEDLLADYCERYQWPVTIFRPQGVFGPHDAQQAAYVFARLRAWRPVFVQEEHAQLRINFLCVHDLVAALVKVIENNAAHGKIYNVAGDDIVTPREFVALCGEVSGEDADVSLVAGWRNRLVGAGLPWLPYDLVADNRAVKADLGIEFMPLKTALAETYSWLSVESRQLALELTPAEAALGNQQQIPLGCVAAAARRAATGALQRTVISRVRHIASSSALIRALLGR